MPRFFPIDLYWHSYSFSSHIHFISRAVFPLSSLFRKTHLSILGNVFLHLPNLLFIFFLPFLLGLYFPSFFPVIFVCSFQDLFVGLSILHSSLRLRGVEIQFPITQLSSEFGWQPHTTLQFNNIIEEEQCWIRKGKNGNIGERMERERRRPRYLLRSRSYHRKHL